MKRILIVMLIIVASIMFVACSDSSDSEQTDKEEVQTNEEPEEEDIEKIEVKTIEGEEYTDQATGVITLTVPKGYIANESPYYNTEGTVATVMVIPQNAVSEAFTSYLIVQVGLIDDDTAGDYEYAGDYADASINAFAIAGEQVDKIELNGLKGFRIRVDDPASEWASEHYMLVGPKANGGDSYYSVYIGGIGLDNSYTDAVHDIISTIEFDFDKL